MMEFGIYPTAEELIDQPVVWYSVPLEKRNHFAGALGTAFGLRAWLLREASKTPASKWEQLSERVIPALEIIAEDHMELYSFFITTLITLAAQQRLNSLPEKFNKAFLNSSIGKKADVLEMFNLIWKAA